MVDETAIIKAHEELSRWQNRYESLKLELKSSSQSELQSRHADIKCIEVQIMYYQNLIKMMKKYINPVKSVSVITSIRGR